VSREVRPVPIELTRELRRAVLRPHESVEAVAGHEAPGTIAVGAFEAGELVACGLIMPAPDGWRVRGMATAPEHRGRGHGAAVLAALLNVAREAGARRVWCNARAPARSLYERAGFRVESEEFELPHIGPHYVMARSLPVSAHGYLDD
jgi:GNAT superfamily N-acetyltransferase